MLGESPFDLRALVAEFVGGVDRDAGDRADRQGVSEFGDGGEVAGRDHVARVEEAEVLQRQEQVGAPPVVPVVLELIDGPFRRVRAILSDRRVEQRNDHEHPDRPGPPQAVARGEGQKWHHQAERPEVSLAIGPTHLLAVDNGGDHVSAP
jgi:hypothetical protein